MSARMLGSLLLLIGLVFSFNAQTTTQTTQTATQPDLSGTYIGTFNCDAVGLTGDTTLTITGNQFTTADGKTGRIVATKNGGYTAVALQVGEATAGSTPQIISLRAKKTGNRLTLASVAGSPQKCTFMPSRTTARAKTPRTTPAATGTEVANPTTPATPVTPATSPTPETPVPTQTPAPSPSPSPSPEPSPEPVPSPMPSPMPNPTPGGSPSPMPSPTASPSPGASPSPSPTPSPTPPRPRA